LKSSEDWSELMAAAQAGDQAAYRALLRDVLPLIRALLRRHGLAPDQQDDAAQDVLLTLHRIRDTYDPRRPFVPWLASIVRYRAIDLMRRTGRVRANERQDDEAFVTFADPASDELETGERRAWLRRAVQDLPPRQREALELVKMRDMSVAEAAAASGQTPGAIKVNVHRGLRRLQAVLRGQSG
jgi:RNA polymerase sigma-70 factor (ECF subfamily)